MKYLTMNIYINAWLDCSNPYISIHNKYDDDLLVHFNSERVNQLIDDGEIFIEDLKSSDPDIQMEVATNLIALKSGERIKQQIHDLSTVLKTREPTTLVDKVINEVKVSRKSSIQLADLFPQYLQSV
ncbi:MAG: hypothetical protein L3J51_10080 [Cocleimonas sp.]|nr:hypothetical protein [Cocleimonas sp.]